MGISDVGINILSRVCDRCYHDMGAALTDKSALTRSFIEDENEPSNDSRDNDDNGENNTSGKGNKRSKTKSNRSAVVDELILRMPSVTISN